jgi:hypothetical protein
MGGDINIIGPGGSIQVGHTTLDLLTPSQEGLLTVAGGTIRVYTDGSILVDHSRIMTEQGGNINLFSANGEISAGEGPKTYVSDPPISQLCDANGYRYVNPQGLVTGAGIGALVTLPGQDILKRNVSLAAPHDIIDAGAAGLRGNNINLVGALILNAFNIQSTGTVTGISYTLPPSLAALTSASSANTATQQTGLPASPTTATSLRSSSSRCWVMAAVLRVKKALRRRMKICVAARPMTGTVMIPTAYFRSSEAVS